MTILPIKDFPALAPLPEPEELYAAFRAYEGGEEPPTLDAAKSEMYGDQVRFQAWKSECVGVIFRSLESFHAQDKDEFSQSFNKLFRGIGIIRQALAGMHHEFGVWRREARKTALIRSQYRTANQKLRTLFASCMPKFGHSKTDDQPESYTFGDKFSRYTIKRYTQKHQKLMYDLTLTFRHVKGGYGPEEEDKIQLLETMRSIRREITDGLQLPELVAEEPLSIQEGRSQLQFFVGTISNQIEGEWVPLTRHITWIKQKERGAVTDAAMRYFEQYGYVTHLHTDMQQFDPLLRSIVNIAYRLIQPNPEVKKFKADLAALDYRLFHGMFFERGSESITESFREAMCQLHQQPVPTAKGESALTQPFLVNYVNDPARYAAAPENGEHKG
jgi:hypothetical protein